MRKLLTSTAIVLTMLTGAASAEGSVEVLHWWTSGGEAAALDVLKKNLESKGVPGRTCRSPAAAASRP